MAFYANDEFTTNCRRLFAVLSSRRSYLVSFGANSFNESGCQTQKVRPMLTVHCFNQISSSCCDPKYSHTFYRVTPHICIICQMRNSYHCWMFIVAVDIIKDKLYKWRNCFFVHSLYQAVTRHQLRFLLNHMQKHRPFGDLFLVSSINARSILIWCMETLIAYHMYLLWHDLVWRHVGRQVTSLNIFLDLFFCTVIW